MQGTCNTTEMTAYFKKPNENVTSSLAHAHTGLSVLAIKIIIFRKSRLFKLELEWAVFSYKLP